MDTCKQIKLEPRGVELSCVNRERCINNFLGAESKIRCNVHIDCVYAAVAQSHL